MSDVLIKTKNVQGNALQNLNLQAPCVLEVWTSSRYLKIEIQESGLLKNVVKTKLVKKKKTGSKASKKG